MGNLQPSPVTHLGNAKLKLTDMITDSKDLIGVVDTFEVLLKRSLEPLPAVTFRDVFLSREFL